MPIRSRIWNIIKFAILPALVMVIVFLYFTGGRRTGSFLSQQAKIPKKKDNSTPLAIVTDTGVTADPHERIELLNRKGTIVKKIDFGYGKGKRGTAYLMSDAFQSLLLKYDSGKQVIIDLAQTQISMINVVRLEGNDYDDLYFEGRRGGSAGGARIDNILNTKTYKILSYSEGADYADSSGTPGYLDESYTKEDLQKEKEYIKKLKKSNGRIYIEGIANY